MTLRRAAAAMSAAALLIITGCGSASDTSDDSSDETSETTSESTESSETTEETSEPVEPAEPGAQLTLVNFASTTSQAQVDAQSVHMEAEGDMQGQSVTMSGDMALGASLEETAFSMTMSAPGMGEDVSMMLVDSIMYLPEGQGSDKYMKIDLSDPNNPMGALFGQIFSQASPSATTEALEGAIEDFKPVGSEEIDGVSTTHYTVTVDTQKVMTKMMGEELMSLTQSSGTGLPKTLTYDFWVGDDDHLLRRMQTDSMGMAMTIDFTEWGEPVDIQAPPESQISEKDPFGGMPMPSATP